ncbi:MAG TPA: ribosome biogenesis factor YjgA [Gammaproteobacteria bacterium]|nr:ribosome biogenesis factor YjgA [Gammaproteobacteria bacterium]
MVRKVRRSRGSAGEQSPAADDAAEGPSRTQLKNESRDLQKLGEALLDLRADAFDALPLPELLREAIAEAKRLKSFGAKRRQLQYIGKLMRRLDADDIAAVAAAVRDQ